MALTNDKAKAVTPQADVKPEQKAQGKKTSASAEIYAQGSEIIASLSEEERAALGAKSGTLHFVHLLGLASKKSPRRVSASEVVDASTPVGVVLTSDEDIEVPVIDVTKDRMTGIDPEKDISYRTVKAGEEFDLTYYEFMYLIIRPEYSGLFEANGDPRGGYFTAKAPAFWRGEAKLPTPTINFTQGSVKSTMVDIDEKGPEGWEVKAQYADKYGALLAKSRSPRRASGKKTSLPRPTVVSAALSKILGVSK